MDYFAHNSSVIDDNCSIGSNTRIWHFCHIQSNSQIGNNCVIGQNVYVGSNVIIGNNCRVQNNVSIYEGVVLEDNVFCGPSVVFTNLKIPTFKFPDATGKEFIKTRVSYGAIIGANATILCGINIGRHSFIGAGALVTKDVPDYALVIGVPAKIRAWVSASGIKLKFDQNGIAYCEKSNKKYILNGKIVKEAE
ncbi:acyltransferase [Candidatus Kapaibacterium sp.]